MGADALDKVDAADARHGHVEQDQIYATRVQGFEYLSAVAGFSRDLHLFA
ncbi:hypothetical protein SAMN04515620_12643 [Collimonas sp. OK607]|nr:hypothetical protein SAMN04515620_12643 [Collimonas sp. OK607]